MASREVTFFGEVAPLTSRATWDDEDDEDLDVSNSEPREAAPDISLDNQVTFTPGNFDLANTPTGIVYVTLGKKIPPSLPLLGEAHITSNPAIHAGVLQVTSQERWIVVDTPPNKRDSWKSVLLIQEVVSKLIGSSASGTGPLFVIATVTPSEKTTTDSLCNTFVEGKKEAARFCRSKLLPPSIVSSVTEAAAFEYCTSCCVSACLVLVPSVESLENPDVYPPEVKKCLQTLLTPTHLDSNIYI